MKRLGNLFGYSTGVALLVFALALIVLGVAMWAALAFQLATDAALGKG
jgi:hypothetical protein